MAKTATKEPNPTYHKFLTEDQAIYIMRAISSGYHARNDYPPFALASFEDRPRYHAYMTKVLSEMVRG